MGFACFLLQICIWFSRLSSQNVENSKWFLNWHAEKFSGEQQLRQESVYVSELSVW